MIEERGREREREKKENRLRRIWFYLFFSLTEGTRA